MPIHSASRLRCTTSRGTRPCRCREFGDAAHGLTRGLSVGHFRAWVGVHQQRPVGGERAERHATDYVLGDGSPRVAAALRCVGPERRAGHRRHQRYRHAQVTPDDAEACLTALVCRRRERTRMLKLTGGAMGRCSWGPRTHGSTCSSSHPLKASAHKVCSLHVIALRAAWLRANVRTFERSRI